MFYKANRPIVNVLFNYSMEEYMANSVNVNFEQGIIENAVLYYTRLKHHL